MAWARTVAVTPVWSVSLLLCPLFHVDYEQAGSAIRPGRKQVGDSNQQTGRRRPSAQHRATCASADPRRLRRSGARFGRGSASGSRTLQAVLQRPRDPAKNCLGPWKQEADPAPPARGSPTSTHNGCRLNRHGVPLGQFWAAQVDCPLTNPLTTFGTSSPALTEWHRGRRTVYHSPRGPIVQIPSNWGDEGPHHEPREQSQRGRE